MPGTNVVRIESTLEFVFGKEYIKYPSKRYISIVLLILRNDVTDGCREKGAVVP